MAHVLICQPDPRCTVPADRGVRVEANCPAGTEGAWVDSIRATEARKRVQMLEPWPPELNAIERIWKELNECVGRRCPMTQEALIDRRTLQALLGAAAVPLVSDTQNGTNSLFKLSEKDFC